MGVGRAVGVEAGTGLASGAAQAPPTAAAKASTPRMRERTGVFPLLLRASVPIVCLRTIRAGGRYLAAETCSRWVKEPGIFPGKG